MPELIFCARSRGINFNKSIKRSELIRLFNPSPEKRVTLPTTITQVTKTLPKLMREYGGIMDFKLDGSFETMSMVPGEDTYVKGTDIPDYEVMWHNHPEVNPGYISTPSLGDTVSLISRKHTQYSLIFTDKGTYVQWVPDRNSAKQHLKLFLEAAKQTRNGKVDRAASDREALELFNKIIYDNSVPAATFIDQLVEGIHTYFKVETVFIPWGQPISLNIIPYEPSIHQGRLTKSQKAKLNK